MVKLAELRTEAEIHEQDMHDVDYRREVERTQFAQRRGDQGDPLTGLIAWHVPGRAGQDDRHAAAQYCPARIR